MCTRGGHKLTLPVCPADVRACAFLLAVPCVGAGGKSGKGAASLPATDSSDSGGGATGGGSPSGSPPLQLRAGAGGGVGLGMGGSYNGGGDGSSLGAGSVAHGPQDAAALEQQMHTALFQKALYVSVRGCVGVAGLTARSGPDIACFALCTEWRQVGRRNRRVAETARAALALVLALVCSQTWQPPAGPVGAMSGGTATALASVVPTGGGEPSGGVLTSGVTDTVSVAGPATRSDATASGAPSSLALTLTNGGRGGAGSLSAGGGGYWGATDGSGHAVVGQGPEAIAAAQAAMAAAAGLGVVMKGVAGPPGDRQAQAPTPVAAAAAAGGDVGAQADGVQSGAPEAASLAAGGPSGRSAAVVVSGTTGANSTTSSAAAGTGDQGSRTGESSQTPRQQQAAAAAAALAAGVAAAVAAGEQAAGGATSPPSPPRLGNTTELLLGRDVIVDVDDPATYLGHGESFIIHHACVRPCHAWRCVVALRTC